MSVAREDPVATVLSAPLAPLRAGGLGFVGPDVPIDLLRASGCAFGHLPWHADAGTPFADSVLESGFPGWSRSILEQWYEGAFDGLHAVVFSRTDDATQRLYYYVRELQRRGQVRGPRPLLLDLALVLRAASVDHSAASVAAVLARELDIDETALRAGIARADALRLKLRQLQLQRSSDGVFHGRLGRALLWSDPTRWIDSVPLPPPGAARRVLLATATGPRAFLDRGHWITGLAQDARAAAVVLWLAREDEALAWQVPAIQRALAAVQPPALLLPVASWRVDAGVLERVAAFCREHAR